MTVSLAKLHYIVNATFVVYSEYGGDNVAYSEAKAASNKRSDAKYQQILIKPYREEAETIRTAAADAGQSLQGYILQAVRERMEREGGDGT